MGALSFSSPCLFLPAHAKVSRGFQSGSRSAVSDAVRALSPLVFLWPVGQQRPWEPCLAGPLADPGSTSPPHPEILRHQFVFPCHSTGTLKPSCSSPSSGLAEQNPRRRRPSLLAVLRVSLWATTAVSCPPPTLPESSSHPLSFRTRTFAGSPPLSLGLAEQNPIAVAAPPLLAVAAPPLLAVFGVSPWATTAVSCPPSTLPESSSHPLSFRTRTFAASLSLALSATMANKANYLHLLAIALLAAAPFCSLLSYVGAVGCDVTYHSSMIVAACSPGSNVSADCCGFVVATLAAGGANCLCLTCIRSQSTGFRTADCEGYYEACGGTGDYDAELRTCSAQDAGTPMLPSTPPPPPPPLQVQKVVEEIPWWHWVLEWLLSLMTFVAILVLLFFIVKFCKGRAGDIAAAALERMLCIAPNAAQPSSVERTVQDNNSSHSIDMSQHRFEEERTSAERNIHRGDEISLTANHFDVKTAYSDITFYHYAVCIKSMDEGKGVHCKHLRRRILSKLQQSYGCRLGYKHLVYDGDRSVFAVGPLPDETFEAIVCLEKTYSRSARKSEGNRFDVGRAQDREEYLTESFKVAINYLAKVSLAPAVLALEGSNSEYTLRVLDSVLRQQHAKRGYLLMKQSYFSNEAHNLVDLTGGVSACFGIHSCFRTTLDGLTLNMDVSTTIVVTPGPVLGFVLASQNLIDVNNIDWSKANEMLKELRVVDKHNDTEVRIIGLSGQPCSRQNFQTRISSGRTIEITVQEYFLSTKGIKLTMPSLPCLDVGKPNNPCYLPIELCHVVSLQRYTKALSSQQRAFFLEKSRQKPEDQIRVVKYARQQESYEDDPVLSSSGIKIEKQLTHISGCVLSAPKLIFGNSEVCIPNGGRWNYNSKMLLEPVKIEHWAIVNFSAHCDMSWLSKELINLGHSKGLSIDHPYALVIEFDKSRICSPVQRVEMMFKRIREKVKNPEFLLCVLPERKNCDIYGCWI